VMDEPTSSLSREEGEQLHRLVRSLRDDGMTIVYVSHFLEEVISLADNVTVFRDGRLVETLPCADLAVDRLVVGMLGRELTATFPDKVPAHADAPVVLSVSDLGVRDGIQNVSFTVRAGEIVGLAGLVGAGRTEVARAIFGADKADHGTVSVAGTALPPGSPPAAIAAGVGFAPEDRKALGLFMDMSQRVNATLPHLGMVCRHGLLSGRRERRVAVETLGRLGVTPLEPEMPVTLLSGGNQQKVMFAKWLLREPKLLLLDEPTRGIDIGAKRSIYDLIVRLAAEGMAVVVISSELEEVVGLAHRVLVMRGGQIVAEFADELSPDAIVNASFGIGLQTPETAVK
jgi:ABC-type sugar transport system ATPase subunit